MFYLLFYLHYLKIADIIRTISDYSAYRLLVLYSLSLVILLINCWFYTLYHCSFCLSIAGIIPSTTGHSAYRLLVLYPLSLVILLINCWCYTHYYWSFCLSIAGVIPSITQQLTAYHFH